MPLVTGADMLKKAQKGKYAVGAFNVENMEMAQAVVAAAEELKAPVMLQTTSSTLKYASPEVFFGMVSALAKKATVPVCLHLDHGSSPKICEDCLQAGYTSVMIDASHSPFDENIAITLQVVQAAKPLGIPVEAELGLVGGKEDETESKIAKGTDPKQAVEFVQKTGVQSLAVAIGTAHGFYAGTPVLDKQLLSDIAAVVPIPLVLHGASGLSDEDVRDCVARGICKVNFATELRVAFTDGVKELFKEKPEAYDPKTPGAQGRTRVTELVKNRMRVCGCEGKATCGM